MKFKKTPFSLSPDPTLLCLNPNINTLLAKVGHVIEYRQGLSVIIGGVGLGKSTVMRYIYASYGAQDEIEVCMIESPEFTSHHALLRAICLELRLETKRSMKEQFDVFRAFVNGQDAKGRTVLILIDEAQKMSTKMFELTRSLLNYETAEHKLVQIVLSGQPELKRKLLLERNRGLKRRIIVTSALEPLSRTEIEEMIAHRCERFSIRRMPFTADALDRIYELSKGVPGEALRLCQLSYELKTAKMVDVALVESVANDGDLENVEAA